MYDCTQLNKSFRLWASLRPNFSRNPQSSLRHFSKIQHFMLSSELPTSTTTLIEQSIYLYRVSYLSCVILLSPIMMVDFLFMIVKWSVKASHKSDEESMLPSERDLYQTMADSIRLVQRACNSWLH